MKDKEKRFKDFKGIPKITGEELSVLNGMIERKVIMSYDQAAQLTGKSTAWLRAGYSEETINKHRLGKVLFCSFNEKTEE